ncbi:MAG: phosphate regulon sensor histidine kinase PhoR, partial [Prolixibacteraceae bacterium]|nr:phosphate regulon sensor histidine kinase PhoR [Burkholderiales bacterium]
MFSPVQKSFLVIALRVTLIAAVIGGIAGLIGGEYIGMMFAALVILLAFSYYAWKLAQLHHWLENPQAATLPDADGMWGDVLGKLYRLIKQERVSQKSLSDALSRFQQAATALPDGALMLDDAHNIVWLNPVAEQHWGISLANDRMQTVTYFIRYPEFIKYLAERNYGEPLALKVSRKDVAGLSKELSLAVQLVPFGEDQMLLLSRDVSERDRLETMRRDFVANVSHELRTPITVMAGFLETITAASTGKPELLEKSLTHMTNQALRMQRLVEDLLALSRLEDNSHRPVQAPINVPELIASLLIDAEQLSAGRHRVSSRIAPDWLLGNRDEIASALSNLISNAVRYTPAGGEVEIHWTIEDGKPVFSVRDNGEGIAPEHVPRLTERFYRVDRGRSQATGGTGLGLAI